MAEVPADLGGSSGQGRKFRPWKAEVPARPEVPAKFRSSSEISPFPCSNIQGRFDGLSELWRNLGGSSDRAEVLVPRGGSSGPMLFPVRWRASWGHLGGIWPEVPVLGGGSSGLGAVAPSSLFPALSPTPWSPWLVSWSMYLIEHRVFA